jgi:hypothetical protein
MVEAYQNIEWSTCAHQIEVMKQHNWNPVLTELYAERIKQPAPDDNWDGIARKTSK